MFSKTRVPARLKVRPAGWHGQNKLACLLLLVSSLAHSASRSPVSHLASPFDLRCSGKSEPLAVLEARPVFSWQLAANSPVQFGVFQSAYRIQVIPVNESFATPKAILWDSGVVTGSATSGIVYAGPSLKAQQAYAWRVEVWDEQKHASGWSREGHWTQAPEWHAAWIAAHPDNSGNDDGPLPIFRKSFTLKRRVARALLYASGLGQDELRINGSKVGSDELTPGWSEYHKTVYYDAYDVTPLVHEGQNALGVMLGNGMYRVLHTPGRYTKFEGSYGQPKCTVQLHIEFADGGSEELASDGTWKTAPGPLTFSSTYGGEDFDGRLEPTGWDRAGFDDRAWRAVNLVDGPGGAMTPEIALPIRVMHTYAPVKVTKIKPGVTVYDLGQNFAGWPEIAVEGPAGWVVRLISGELLDKDGQVLQRSSGRPQWFSYTLRGSGVETWHPRFSYYGFRYVQIESSNSGGGNRGGRVLRLAGSAVHSSSRAVGEFATSDQLLNRIHNLILRAIENNAVSIFTDCPHREKLGWLEETHLMAPSMLYDFDFADLYAATARNIADTQRREGDKAGMVPEIAPQYVVFDPANQDMFNDSPEWGSAAVLAPWAVFERTGNREFLGAQYNVMRAYTRYLGTRAHDGIVAYGLGDWYDIGPGEPGFSKLTTAGVTGTAIYYQDLKTLERTAEFLGKTDESRDYAEQANAVRTTFNTRFFNTKSDLYDKGSQTAQAMPLTLGLTPEKQRAAVLDALAADIRAHQNHTTSGEVGFHYAVGALLDGGRSDVLLDMLERTDAPSYGYQLAQGATSLTEGWDASHSQDHFMLGSAEEWFYRGLGGINFNLSRQGADRLVLHPAVVEKIAWVRASYNSAIGMIKSDWQRGAHETAYTFVIPVNATATIEIDSPASGAVVVNGSPAAKAAGVIATQARDGEIELTVESGKYLVRAENPAR
jgi:hypothetical protein